jgi:tetratricopeptide (TPR) repeat protein
VIRSTHGARVSAAVFLAAWALALALLNPCPARARGDEEKENAGIFNDANERFASKDYESALKLYEELIERGVKNPSLYYNLGNAHFKKGSLGYAILYYEKSLSLAPFDRDARSNLEYARRSVKERVRPLYNERLHAFAVALSSLTGAGTLAYTELFFFALSIGVANLAIFMPYARARLKRLLAASLVLFALSALALLWHAGYDKTHPRGIVVEKQVQVLSAPIAESEALFSLPEGTAMRVRETRGEWARVKVADGREGWLPVRHARFI